MLLFVVPASRFSVVGSFFFRTLASLSFLLFVSVSVPVISILLIYILAVPPVIVPVPFMLVCIPGTLSVVLYADAPFSHTFIFAKF